MCERYLCRDACSGRSRNGLGRGAIGTAARRFRKDTISWQAQHFGEPRYRFSVRRSTFERPRIDFVAGAAFPQCWHGRIANLIGTGAQGGACRFRGRRSTFARSGAHFVAGATLSHGRERFRGRRSTFARSGTDFVAGAALSQGHVLPAQPSKDRECAKVWQGAGNRCLDVRKVPMLANSGSFGSKIATFKYESSSRSVLCQLGLENRNFEYESGIRVLWQQLGSKIATLKYESSTRSVLWQLWLENRNF